MTRAALKKIVSAGGKTSRPALPPRRRPRARRAQRPRPMTRRRTMPLSRRRRRRPEVPSARRPLPMTRRRSLLRRRRRAAARRPKRLRPPILTLLIVSYLGFDELIDLANTLQLLLRRRCSPSRASRAPTARGILLIDLDDQLPFSFTISNDRGQSALIRAAFLAATTVSSSIG